MTTETLDTALAAGEPSAQRMATPHMILAGFGVTDSLQLSVETQRTLARYGSAYALGAGPNLLQFLKSQRVKVTDLTERIAPGRAYADSYLDVAHFLVERTAHERPVVVLAPGHPLMFNAITRYLATEGKRLELTVQVLPGISPLDAIIGGIGLDVSTFGLQVFDCTRLVQRGLAITPSVPAILMNAGTAGFSEHDVRQVPDLRPLVTYLQHCYPPDHHVSVLALTDDGMAVAPSRLRALPEVADKFRPSTHLFIDAVPAPNKG